MICRSVIKNNFYGIEYCDLKYSSVDPIEILSVS